MRAILLILALTLVIVAYVTFVRDLLKTTDWGCRFLAWIEPFELHLYRKSETILWARFKVFVGALLAFLMQIGTIDFTPFVVFLPEAHQDWARKFIGLLPLLISLVGIIDEKLRRSTTKPLEVVAIPASAPPEVKEAVREVEVTNAEAVAKVQEAKAEGAV